MSRGFARDLRRNMTDAERRLWRESRYRQQEGCKFRRQALIGKAGRVQYDEERTRWLVSQGFRVLRFWNHQVFEEIDVVIEVIWRALVTAPTPALPHEGGGRKK